jgi:3-oxoacyl-[acyl-carrier-protein] synthase II
MNAFAESDRRVVVTGMGILSPAGIGCEEFWENLSLGRSGVKPIQLLAASACPDNAGGEVSDFNAETIKKRFLKEKEQRKSIKVMCREIQMGVASALMAYEHAGLAPEAFDHARLGIDFGANLMTSPPEDLSTGCFACANGPDHVFHYEQWGDAGLGKMDPLWLLRYLPNMPACHIAIFLDARGPSNSLTHDEASANLAISESCRIILRGDADVMISGATGTRIHSVRSMHTALWDELARSPADPAARCRPFDADRQGQVPGEGACSLVLEDEQHALARGATIYGRVLGSGSSCVYDWSQRGDSPRAIVNAIRFALEKAGIAPEDVGHINANGIGTRAADLAEAAAIREVFGAYAERIPVTALKSFTGNSGSGCGAQELAGSLLGLKQGVIPHTLNCDRPDPECGLNIVRHEPLPTENKIVLNINSTRVGQAGAVLVQGV